MKITGYAGTDGNFLSHAHYRDLYFDFIHLLTKLTSNQLLSKIIQYYILFYITYVHAPWSQNRDLCSVHGIRNSRLCLHTLWSSLVHVLFSPMNYLTISWPLDPYFPFLNQRFLISSSLISFLAHVVGICMVGYIALINCCRVMDSCANLSLLYRGLGHQPVQWAISWKGMEWWVRL